MSVFIRKKIPSDCCLVTLGDVCADGQRRLGPMVSALRGNSRKPCSCLSPLKTSREQQRLEPHLVGFGVVRSRSPDIEPSQRRTDHCQPPIPTEFRKKFLTAMTGNIYTLPLEVNVFSQADCGTPSFFSAHALRGGTHAQMHAVPPRFLFTLRGPVCRRCSFRTVHCQHPGRGSGSERGLCAEGHDPISKRRDGCHHNCHE